MDFQTQLNEQRSTLEMVAQRAGVSPSTVSRIINGTAKVSPTKQMLVEQAIKDLKFQPDLAAKSLASGKTKTIGVLTQFIDSPFYGEALCGIEDVLHAAQYAPLFVSGHWSEDEEKNRLLMLQQRKVDGVIVLTGRLSDATLATMAKRMPVVVTGRRLSAPHLFSIDFDNHEGACLAVRHLYGLGHRRVAFISGPLDHPDAVARLAGYQAQIKQLGMNEDDELVAIGDFQSSGGYRMMNQLLQSRVAFTAVITANDQMAYGASLALARAGMRVPDDVSLVGFDDLAHSAYTVPPLTTIRQSVYTIGSQAAQAMLDLLNGIAPTTQMMAANIVVRESTRICRR